MCFLRSWSQFLLIPPKQLWRTMFSELGILRMKFLCPHEVLFLSLTPPINWKTHVSKANPWLPQFYTDLVNPNLTNFTLILQGKIKQQQQQLKNRNCNFYYALMSMMTLQILKRFWREGNFAFYSEKISFIMHQRQSCDKKCSLA